MRRSKKTSKKIWTMAATVIILAGVFVILIPLFWMLTTSLKTYAEAENMAWLPRAPQWANYFTALKAMNFWRALGNTILITFLAMTGHVFSCALVAYGFSRLRFPFRDPLFVILLATMMIPGQVTMIPIFIEFKALGWVDTFYPLIVPAFLGGSAFFIFLLRQFFMTIPTELDDAARIDGCSHFGIFFKIIVPLSKPALLTVALFSFMYNWNDFMGPLIYLNSPEKKTLALALQDFNSLYAVQPHLMMAASLVIMLPCLAIFFFAQRYFIKGMVITGVKG
ncbi:sugar ABC transporter ATP-binding protein [candidate division WOR-3 bacterium JGI_Cruoil_03_44_89]|uniref:Sugar ABC transporter ATP-binding protein n=1 Tax=candidate division WOR-3 bacterium JGI_Cruoil_03_44_89 TaxID=1973748 RepID=A0A235BRW5_UNCW3|nr:MAG: sugar ABC transporter ATP-binding protein [candidate division WOR-3 bacterium JGI_Cruoil_03_44_89]